MRQWHCGHKCARTSSRLPNASSESILTGSMVMPSFWPLPCGELRSTSWRCVLTGLPASVQSEGYAILYENCVSTRSARSAAAKAGAAEENSGSGSAAAAIPRVDVWSSDRREGEKCDGGGWSGEREGSATSADVNADVSRMWVADEIVSSRTAAPNARSTTSAPRRDPDYD